MTAFVFIGFVFLLIYDLEYNVRNKPYTFKVQDKYMTREEHVSTTFELADFKESQEIALVFEAYFENGTYDSSFNPLDNDYIDIISTEWDST